MGAVPGCGLLNSPARVVPSGPLFDVEQFRHLEVRTVVAREADHPTLVLGSTQPDALLSPARVAEAGVEVVRRRGGGGAVFLQPDDHLWLDAWIPRHDPLWSADVSTAARWVGAWWCGALGASGLSGLEVHEGRAEPGPLGPVVCFAGRGPGEVFAGGRKVVGLSQWRSRQGALFLSCCYSRWRPGPLVELLDVDGPARGAMARDLAQVAVGLDDLARPGSVLPAVRSALLSTFGGWGSGGGPAAG